MRVSYLLLIKKTNWNVEIIKPSLVQGKMALFEEGLTIDEKVIVSDLFPAIPEMTLTLTRDKRSEQAISDWVDIQ